MAEANQALYEIITDNQTRRRQWSKTYEGIMVRLMELSVELRKPAMVKEALHKYRAMCMQSNVSSLDDVVRILVSLAEKHTEKARKSVDETIIAGADDLEEGAMETPETLLLEAAGHPLTKERVDRQHVVPWMRFLWEVYRVVLDIVKTHNKLEICYHEMAARAFSFCIKYKRYMEFRRLCDMLRQHLNQLISYPRNSVNDVKITDSDTLQKFLETRFTQLSTAVTLEHWQEAYRTIEDIHMIMSMGKTKTRPQHMSIYYDKLMQVFWVSGNYLYHAHALYKLYALSVRQNRNLSEDDARTMASKLLLAALSIPVYDAQSAVLSDSYGAMTDVLGTPMSENAARHARMASLLGYATAAERKTLINELLSKGVLKACHTELSDLYSLLEGEMAPLQFSSRFKHILGFVESHDILKVYTVPLRRVAIFRLLEQLGRVYDVMRMCDVKKVASFAEYIEVEDTALTALKTRSLSLRFDHQNQCLRFESELFSTDGMRSQLGRLGKRLAITSQMLTAKSLEYGDTASDREIVAVAKSVEARALARRLAAIAEAKESTPWEEKKVLERKELIERRKEDAERRNAEIVRQKKINAARELARQRERQKAEEAQRRAKEQQLRMQKGAEEAAARAGNAGGVIGAELEDESAREERLTREKAKELKQAAEQKKKAQNYANHLNHVERALREEQWEPLKRNHTEETLALAKLMEDEAEKDLSDAKSRHAMALIDKKATFYLIPEFEKYMDDVLDKVEGDFDKWVRAERKKLEDEKAKEMAERQAIEDAERLEEERIEKERLADEIAKEESMRLSKQQAALDRLRTRSGTLGNSAASGSYRPGSFARRGKTEAANAPSLKNDIATSRAPVSLSARSAAASRPESSGMRREGSGLSSLASRSQYSANRDLEPRMVAGASRFAPLSSEAANSATSTPAASAPPTRGPRRFINSKKQAKQ